MTADKERPKSNVVLIGMPASGKSTVGVILAKALGCGFIDTDILIQTSENRCLEEIIQEKGTDGFRSIEETRICGLDVTRHVIATGGSAVYSPAAMEHLACRGLVVHLDVALADLRERLGDLDARGVLYAPGQDLAGLYGERLPLYRQWADISIDCRGRSAGRICAAIHSGLLQSTLFAS